VSLVWALGPGGLWVLLEDSLQSGIYQRMRVNTAGFMIDIFEILYDVHHLLLSILDNAIFIWGRV
jgi:protoheme ferro-lyase